MKGVGGGINASGGEDVGKGFSDFALSENSKALTLGDCKPRGIYRKGKFVKHGFKGGNGGIGGKTLAQELEQ